MYAPWLHPVLQPIMSSCQHLMQATSLHLMVEGVAVLAANRDDGSTASSHLYSGYLFNLAVCNAFGVFIGLERAPIE